MTEDAVQIVNLEKMSEARRYMLWVFRTVQKHLGQRILEVGSGCGNFTELLLGRDLVIPTDASPEFIEILKRRFPGGFRAGPMLWDISKPLGEELPSCGLDTVVCMNVLEHVKDDLAALENMRAILEPGGKAVLQVPAFQFLYGTVDESIGHYRRYGRRGLTARMEKAGLSVEEVRFMNVVGMPAWFINGRIFRHTTMVSGQIRFFERLVVPWVESIERLIKPPIGLTMIAIGRRV